MTNTKRKSMYKTNKLFRRWLKENGYYDIWFFPHSAWFTDVFGIADGVCKRPIECTGAFEIVWLQMSTGKKNQDIKDKIDSFCKAGNQQAIVWERVKLKKKYQCIATMYPC